MNYVALLRGINMGGHKKVAMSDLRALAEGLGFSKVQTLLQSGNLVFGSSCASSPALEKKLEAALAKRLALITHVLVRDAAEWAKLVSRNPYTQEAIEDPSHLAVLLMKDKPAASAVAALRNAIVGREVFEANGRTLYAYFPDGMGTSKFTTALMDRTLRTTVTGRNWNTVLKIAAALGL